MNKTLVIISLIGLLILPASYDLGKLDFREARLINVCKDLSGEALLYFIFVDSKSTAPWTEFDIQSTVDSVRTAINWLHQQARKNDVNLNIKLDFYIGKEYTTINKTLPGGTVQASVSQPNFKKGKAAMNYWADGITRTVGSSVTVRNKDGIPEVDAPRTKERLVALLRDENSVESVALFYMVNNYFKSDISIPLNIFDTEDVEFAIVSYKYPSEIAHNFLHLYGAADMYSTIYRRNNRKIEKLQILFPDEIMLDPYGKNIWDLEISDYTRYLIGWDKEMKPEYEYLMTDRRFSN